MGKRIWSLAILMVIASGPPTWGQSPKKPKAPPVGEILPLLDAKSPQALAGVLRGAIVQFLPNPLFEASPGWGRQSLTANQLKWHRDGILLKPKIYKTPKNDGTWKKTTLTAINPADTLVLDLRNVQSPQPNRLDFDVFLALDTRVEYHHQLWENGTRLYAASVKARLRVKLLLKCTATVKLEAAKQSWFPDALFHLHAVGANLSYDNLIFEHVAGIGGTGAKVLGNSIHNIVTDFNPDLERKLLDRAAGALVKAADTKEVRVSLGRVFEKFANAGK